VYCTGVGGERTECVASQFGVRLGSVVEWVESCRSGRVGRTVRPHGGSCLNEEHIHWKTNLWSLDPEDETMVFLQNVGKY
jgi:hypothetical protein